MSPTRCLRNLLVCLVILSLDCRLVLAAEYVAYSMREAQRRLIAGAPRDGDVDALGGMTHLAGMVHDEVSDDWIVVGAVVGGCAAVTLDELIAAIRAIALHRHAPEVSIDATAETATSGLQVVNFKGGVENTQFGKDMLDMDVLLKQIALGKASSVLWGVDSYLAHRAKHASETGKKESIASRFWFENAAPALSSRQGVLALTELEVKITTQLLHAEADGRTLTGANVTGMKDAAADAFAAQVTVSFEDLSSQYPLLRRARSVLAAASIAQYMHEEGAKLDFWLNTYQVKEVPTPKTYRVIENEMDVAGRELTVRVSGGFKTNPMLARLKRGHFTAFREVVLRSRPSDGTLVWHPPLQGWPVAGVTDVEADPPSAGGDDAAGFSVHGVVRSKGGSATSLLDRYSGYASVAAPARLPGVTSTAAAEAWRPSSAVGGVMLRGRALVGNGGTARSELADGGFSLVVDGRNARVAPEGFRRFVTALWAVYYGAEDPGISIDPIEWGGKQHLVRYIGKVINSDLGRVMREADYLMKKWAVGTERPQVAGFMNPDDISGRRGFAYYGASSRFWFVPGQMRFKEGGGLLLYDSGRMTVKTEFNLHNPGSLRADPANERFAQFLTDHYGELADKHRVLTELFDYAKLVQLAKYLKESGVPLFWFLLANKDLVLTEDAPGTVDALAKGSDYFKNLRIEGGVNLAPNGRYVFDQAAVSAVNDAVSRQVAGGFTNSASVPANTRPSAKFSFEFGGRAFSVLPQQSLTSGRDRRGNRYQTDLALKATGFQLTDQDLEELGQDVVRSEFARAWNDWIEGKSDDEVKAQGETFSQQALAQAEAAAKAASQGLASLANRAFDTQEEYLRAATAAVGKERAKVLTPLLLRHGHYWSDLELVRYFSSSNQTPGDFGAGWRLLVPYQLRPAGNERAELGRLLVPKAIVFENLLAGHRETLTLSTSRFDSAAYVPENGAQSQVIGLFLTVGGTYRLLDKLGNEFRFDEGGYLTEMILSEDHHLRIEYHEGLTTAFGATPYAVEPAGDERTTHSGVSLPKRMRVKDLIHGGSQTLVLGSKGPVLGYVPEEGETSSYEILALLSNASFRLLDKQGQEVAFTAAGTFQGLIASPAKRLVKSFSNGRHTVNFAYTVGRAGDVLIAGAQVAGPGVGSVGVRYQYDDEDRLYAVQRSELGGR